MAIFKRVRLMRVGARTARPHRARVREKSCSQSSRASATKQRRYGSVGGRAVRAPVKQITQIPVAFYLVRANLEKKVRIC